MRGMEPNAASSDSNRHSEPQLTNMSSQRVPMQRTLGLVWQLA